MKKNAFTLTELLGVIVILTLISIVVVPLIINQINQSRSEISKATESIIFNAANLYLQDYSSDYPKTNGAVYCVSLGELIEDGKLKSPLTDVETGNELDLTKIVKLSIVNNLVEKELVNAGECTVEATPSAPVLASNMVPIKWDGSKWVKADSKNPSGSNQWYDYSSKIWANVVTVKESSRSFYLNASVGTEVKEEDVLTYLVWIPRYRYQLFNVEAVSISPRTIDIVFESKTRVKSKGTANGQYLTHPAFTFGDTELSGIWVGKFETTGSISEACTSENCTTAQLTIKPNLTSVRNQTVSSMFYATRSMQKQNNMYGFSGNDLDIHMTKNTEWGAVAYLTQSKYGRNSEIWINNSTNYITGCVANSASEAQSANCKNEYSSSIGGNGSTTGNIYGIYDMSGGAWEYVLGAMYNSDNSTMHILNSGFNQTIIDSVNMAKYIDKYIYGETYNDQSAYNRRILGDATGEVRGWFNDSADFVTSHSWFARGSDCFHKTEAGVFTFSRDDGAVHNYLSFRVVVSES